MLIILSFSSSKEIGAENGVKEASPLVPIATAAIPSNTAWILNSS